MRSLKSVPTVFVGPAAGIDGLSEQGARQLASTIEKVWAAKGYRVRAWIEQVSVQARQDGGGSVICWRVQSDLVGGLPPGYGKTTKKKSAA